ncbi:MAG TPA: hypothetical protein VGU20_31685 [Stellaceae bacterium]|nr:hypothetical protein [Stellaceae bacterium]
MSGRQHRANAGPIGTSQRPNSGAWQHGRKDLFYPCGKTYAQSIGGSSGHGNEMEIWRTDAGGDLVMRQLPSIVVLGNLLAKAPLLAMMSLIGTNAK